ncbi:MAG: integrase family protein [Betaproteobacteria bacterium]
MAKVAFTAGRVTGFKCPADKAQVFLWDTAAPGLGLRVTPAGKPSYVFQGRYQEKTVRLTIGSPDSWSIPQAQEKARELQRQLDEGRDPREVKAEKTAADVAKRDADRQDAVTVAEAWAVYLAERKPHWGERHYSDHVLMAKAGGEKKARGTRVGNGLTIAGPIHPLLAYRLADLTIETIEAWAVKEAKTRPTYARLAWRCLKAFLTWCGEQADYKTLVPVNPAKSKKARESLGKPAVKSGSLERSQLSAWFDAVQKLSSPVASAYLQTMLLTGARPGEILAMRWEDVNTKWKGLTIRDKVEGERVIPLTPYVWHLLATLPKRNEWVFSSTRAVKMDDKNIERREQRADANGVDMPVGDIVETSATGHITVPRSSHNDACTVAGLEGLTLHDLRRSFKSLTEWLEIPAGVVAQLMGHKPSATAEKHYTVRPLDLLRVHHERIEAWMLEQAGIVFDAEAAPGALRVVHG